MEKGQVESLEDSKSEEKTGDGSTTLKNSEERVECPSELDGNLKTIQLKPRLSGKSDLSLLTWKESKGFREIIWKKRWKRKRHKIVYISTRMDGLVEHSFRSFSEPHFRSHCKHETFQINMKNVWTNKRIFPDILVGWKGLVVEKGKDIFWHFCYLCTIYSCRLKYASFPMLFFNIKYLGLLALQGFSC